MNIQTIFFLAFFATFTHCMLSAQELTPSIVADFIIDGKQLDDPFIGGLNAPQLSNVDFNNDGLEDVLIFDRIGSVIIPMLRTTDGFEFDPIYVENFPVIEHFLLMKDYNADGIADIFCYSTEPGVPGVSVYIGKYTNDRIDFDLFTYPDYEFQVLNFELANGSFSNIAVLNTDIPSIEDIDGDGDLDIITFNFLGGYVEYYQNLVVERGESLDGFYFLKVEDCYGGIYESGLSEFVELADAPGECANTLMNGDLATRHAGSTVLSIDYDQDGDYELLLGDLSFNNITLLENGGTVEEAWFSKQIVNYPDGGVEPVDIPIFPGAFYVDINGDDVKDFVAAPNNINNSLDTKNVWYYVNDGANDLLDLSLVTKDLFGRDMVDLGTTTSPTFVDVNADGLLDLVVGIETTFVAFGERDGRLNLFLNEGSATEPVFNLVDENWLDFRRFNSDAYDFMPTFADLDNDGDLDLYAGETNGHIYFVENIAGAGMPMEFGPIIPNWLDIDVGKIAAPLFYDADKDGLLDLIIGERNGNINFYKNIGNKNSPNYDIEISAIGNVEIFGQIDTRTPPFIVGYSKPIIIPTKDGDILITGTGTGNLEVYGLNSDLESKFPLLNESLGNLRVGIQTAPAFADINGDGIYEAMIGNRRGGLSGFQTNIRKESVSTSGVERDSTLKLRSNLVRDRIQLADELPAEMTIYSVLGQLVGATITADALDISDLTSGIYFVYLKRGNVQNTVKFVKH